MDKQTIHEGVNTYVFGPERPVASVPEVIPQQSEAVRIGSVHSNGEVFDLMRDINGREYGVPAVQQHPIQEEMREAELHMWRKGDRISIAAEGNSQEAIRDLLTNPLGLTDIHQANSRTKKNNSTYSEPSSRKELMPSMRFPGKTAVNVLAALALVSVSASVVYGAETAMLGNQASLIDFRNPAHMLDNPVHDAKRVGKIISWVAPW